MLLRLWRVSGSEADPHGSSKGAVLKDNAFLSRRLASVLPRLVMSLDSPGKTTFSYSTLSGDNGVNLDRALAIVRALGALELKDIVQLHIDRAGHAADVLVVNAWHRVRRDVTRKSKYTDPNYDPTILKFHSLLHYIVDFLVRICEGIIAIPLPEGSEEFGPSLVEIDFYQNGAASASLAQQRAALQLLVGVGVKINDEHSSITDPDVM